VKPVDKKHQLKADYVVVSQNKKEVKVHDPYNGSVGTQRLPQEFPPGTKFNFGFDYVCHG
jgi:hypothetical protein